MRENPLKARLRRNEMVVGGLIGLPSPALVEMMGHAGFDCVIIDNEHGALNAETIEHMIRAADASGTVPIVRVPQNIQGLILKALDSGALGVHVPQVNSAEDAAQAVAAAKYPPIGQRGAAYTVRGSAYGQVKGRPYMDRANENVMVIVHIETVRAVDDAARIAATPGLDCIFVGPTDLSVSMGLDDPNHPRVKEAVRHVIAEARKAGVPVGTLASDGPSARAWAAEGAPYVLFSMGGFFARTCQDVVRGARAG